VPATRSARALSDRLPLVGAALLVAALVPAPALGAGARCQTYAGPLHVVAQAFTRHDGVLVADVLVENPGPEVLHRVEASVALYNFFGELLRVDGGVLTPSLLPPAARGSLRIVTPFTQSASRLEYRFTGFRRSAVFHGLVVCDAPSVS
jgi:hypothetical protein